MAVIGTSTVPAALSSVASTTAALWPSKAARARRWLHRNRAEPIDAAARLRRNTIGQAFPVTTVPSIPGRSPGRSLGKMFFNQLAHARIPSAIGFFAEHHADQVATVTAHRGDQVVTRRLGIAGLDTVNALHFPEQGIVITDLDAVIP